MDFDKIVLGIRLTQYFAKTHNLTNIFMYYTQSIEFYINIFHMGVWIMECGLSWNRVFELR